MLEPVKIAFGQFVGEFYRTLLPTTKPLQEYVTRGLDKSIFIAPSRMIDAAEEMLASYQRNDTHQAATQPFKMPVIIIAVAKDYMPTGRDYAKQIAEPISVIIPSDDKERHFGFRTINADIRAQLAIFAMDEPTAKSLASQWQLYLDRADSRRFLAHYAFAGQDIIQWVQIEDTGIMASNAQTESKNLTILACDVTLKSQIPLFDAPKAGDENNDGKGIPGTDDPAGYLLVNHVDITKQP